jgi:putative cobalamin synthesis protein cobW
MAKRDDDLEFSVNAAFDEARAVVDKVPLYLVNGSLGAGKTSVLEFLLQQSDYKGARVIENEYANENIDGYRLEGLAEMVTTLAGDCVCCSSKHALTRMLLDFCRNSPAPVFIEATGVARTMNLVEKLINAQIFNKYELMQSFYVIDAHEILNGVESAHEIELQAADVILVTKEDLLKDGERSEYNMKRRALPYAKVISAPHGRFDFSKITTPSGLLAFFDTYDGELAVPDNPTYAVLDVSGMKITATTLEKI